jgi:hypothetical protein
MPGQRAIWGVFNCTADNSVKSRYFYRASSHKEIGGQGGLGFVITLILLPNVSRSTGRQNAETSTIPLG